MSAARPAPEQLTMKSLTEMRAWIVGAKPDDEVLVPVRLFAALVAEAERGRAAKARFEVQP